MDQETMPAGRDGAPKQRVDWRTGKPMLCRDAAFWQEHERRRQESGMSMPQYCKANGLALSTYRHRISGQRSGQGSSAAVQQQPEAAVAAARFVAIGAAAPSSEAASSAEVSLGDGMTVRFAGAAADALLQHVMARLP
jgi:hypothetical protein